MNSRLTAASQAFSSCWKTLVATDLLYKILAFIVLTPLLGSLFRFLLATFGDEVLSDVEIALFFLGPAGWLCLIVVGSLWLGIVFLEQTSLLGILAARHVNRTVTPLGALRFAAAHATSVVRLTMRIILLIIAAVVPFLVVAGGVYFSLLTEYDINYYLKESPPVFRVAVGIGVALLLGLAAVLLWMIANYFFALPLLLFEKLSPTEALRESRRRVHGHRRIVLVWLLGWAGAILVVSAIASAIVTWCSQQLMPDSTTSLNWLVVAIGVSMLLLTLVNLATNLLGTTTFTAMLFTLYQSPGEGSQVDLAAQFEHEAANYSGPKITRPRVAAISLIGILVAILIGTAALESVQLEDNVQIMAHRGASSKAPENTLASFQQAIEDGADWIELDVQETADGQVVVMHDSDFMKLSKDPLKIWDATSDKLKGIDVGSWKSPDFADQRVPTLAEVLALCKDKVGVNIELKYYGHDQMLEQRVADVVDQQGMNDQVMAMSLKREGVQKMKAIRPQWKVGLLMSVAAGNLSKLDADFLAVNARFADVLLIDQAHDNGKQVFVWTVNDAATMSTMMSRGVDGILTDKPELAQSVLEQRAAMSTPQRLLLEFSGLLGIEPKIADQ
ncbi:Glycerophosphoryl diester phosphodiesterase [Bremerella volcania]|uniref:Glycerophosphoryl diester phosphodiesterase n=1 Tax=Bremerella volcania TaxID=2527984 RepID=A0A518C1J6_9BACT|nr:glycerophosphodiester phosphodiesterase [Bremerella volcania]QDU73096.1 Glycerophosphoryl diester phosphodiesterase [Bremerella volcania]